jgi:hypothetical protein
VLISHDKKELNLNIPETVQLSATTNCGDATSTKTVTGRLIQWSSSSQSTASVDGSGLVLAKALGSSDVTVTMPRACNGRWPTAANDCPLVSDPAAITVFKIVVELFRNGAKDVWQPTLRWIGASRAIFAQVLKRYKTADVDQGVDQTVTWTVSPGGVVIAANGRVTGTAAGSAVVKATSTIDGKASDSKPVYVIDGPQLTAADLIGDIDDLKTGYSLQEWDGMDYPADFCPRSYDAHIQGIARAGGTWVLTHSRNSSTVLAPNCSSGVLIWGTDKNWSFSGSVGIGNHPGGIQASGDVVIVPHFTKGDGVPNTEGIKFFRFDGSNAYELTDLAIDNVKGGNAAGLGYHPEEDRWYAINGGCADPGPNKPSDVWRSRPGLALTDAGNSFYEDESSKTKYGQVKSWCAQGAMQLAYDETSSSMYILAMDRPEGDNPLYQNTHQINATRVNFSEPDSEGEDAGMRNDFDRTDNVLFKPTFRMGAGLLIAAADGEVSIVAVERCTSWQFDIKQLENPLPCEDNDKVEYFILKKE